MTNTFGFRRSSPILLVVAAWSCYAGTSAPTIEAFAKMPLSFEANQGQADSRVAYLAHGIGYTVFLTRQEAVLALTNGPGQSTNVLRMSLASAQSNPVLEGLEPLTGHVNYLIGNDTSRWHTGIPNFGRVRYKDVYPGIDMVYYGSQGQLEYDFVARPGSDPTGIRLRFAGARGMRIAADGDLVLLVAGEEIRFRRPVIYQEPAAGQRVPVDGRFVLRARGEAGFWLGAYDHSRALVIDPAIVRSTFLGGKGKDIGYGIAVDFQGLVYVAGSTTSAAGFPLVGCFHCALGGTMDAFVTVFVPTGAGFVYSTYLGGSGVDAGYGIATDNHGNAYVTGMTNSVNFPVVACVQCVYGGGTKDAFVTALNPGGFPIYSTYLGGKGADIGYGIAADTNGDAVVTGSTNSHNFLPVPHPPCFQCAPLGGTDAFVTGYNPGGGLMFSTYLGGAGNDVGYGISLDANHEIGVTGSTDSLNFPVVACAMCATAGGLDAFASTLIFSPPTMLLKWSTYWGGSGNDAGFGIVMDSPGEAWITGYTDSVNFPITPNCVQCVNAGGQDAIVVRFNVSSPAFSDYLGGAGNDTGRGIVEAQPAAGGPPVVYLTGDTTSLNFPLVACIAGVGCANNGLDDAFVAEYSLAGGPIRLFSSYLGGKNNDAGRGIAFGPYGVYVTGNTSSPNYPVVAPCTQCVYSGGGDAFVTVIR